MKLISSPQLLREAVYGFRRSRIILTAFELDLFSKLADQSLDSEKLAKPSAPMPGPPTGC